MKLLNHLSQIAFIESESKGRVKKQKFHEDDFRAEYQHDRDRIIYSKAFRRLDSKTQVVLSHHDDHNRTRLTHSIEVGQIAQSIGLKLGLNIFLIEAIALGHDLGHSPFGHGGESAVDDILKDYGMYGFKHNYQSLLVVNSLEKRWPNYLEKGLNLMWETRDGILKHTNIKKGPIDNLEYYDKYLDKSPYPATVEGQVVRVSDEIAQRSHDLNDGLRFGGLSIDDLLKDISVSKSLKYINMNKKDVYDHFKRDRDVAIYILTGGLLKYYIYHLIKSSLKNIRDKKVNSLAVVKKVCSKKLIIDFDESFKKDDKEFKTLLEKQFYRSHEISRMDSRAKYFIQRIFKAYKKNPRQLPKKTFDEYKKKTKGDCSICCESCDYVPNSKAKFVDSGNITCPHYAKDNKKKKKPACGALRVIANHIAGMTDSYAHMEYQRLYLPPKA